MLAVGENPNKVINDFSKQFEHDFIQLLRTSHNTKPVHMNHFYQNYIANKEHVHMNATKYKSLTEFAKYLGTHGICRVEENEKGLHIAWIDNSPEALRRQDAARKRERMDRGDEEREQKQILEQVRRAQALAKAEEDAADEARALQRNEGEKITLSFGSKPAPSKLPTPPRTSDGEGSGQAETTDTKDAKDTPALKPEADTSLETPAPAVKMSFGAVSNKPKNVFAMKKNPLAAKKSTFIEAPKKMSEAERIMKEELERKRAREQGGLGGFGAKRQKVS